VNSKENMGVRNVDRASTGTWQNCVGKLSLRLRAAKGGPLRGGQKVPGQGRRRASRSQQRGKSIDDDANGKDVLHQLGRLQKKGQNQRKEVKKKIIRE